MDEIIKTIKNKRLKLGLPLHLVAQKAGISNYEARKIESGTIDWNILAPSFHEYWQKRVFSLDNVLNEKYQQVRLKIEEASRLKEKLELKEQQKKVGGINSSDKKRTKSDTPNWSLKYTHCIKCGTTSTKHLARGLCATCYHKHTEKKHKKVNRSREYGGSSSILTEEYLYDNYVDKEKSLSDIAKDCNCSRQYVYKLIKSYNIPTRNKDSARKIALRRGKVTREAIGKDGEKRLITLQKVKINELFFKSWSPEMAYVLGVIYSDGNLSSAKNIYRVTVSQKEPELLVKILSLMDCNAKLHFKRKLYYGDLVSGSLYWFTIAVKSVYADLVKLGLTPNKSLTVGFPEVPTEYARHFIRGCWDGDGSVYITGKSNNIGANYVSGSKNFIEGMLKELEKAGLPKRNIYSNNKKPPSYSFKFFGSQCVELYHYLYDKVPSTQYLERKYQIFNFYAS